MAVRAESWMAIRAESSMAIWAESWMAVWAEVVDGGPDGDHGPRVVRRRTKVST